jgi:hypothetical protein
VVVRASVSAHTSDRTRHLLPAGVRPSRRCEFAQTPYPVDAGLATKKAAYVKQAVNGLAE